MGLPLVFDRHDSWIMHDYMKHFMLLRTDYKYYIYKILYRSAYTPIRLRWLICEDKTRINFGNSFNLQRKVCRVTGRAHYVITNAGLARMPFKFISGSGLLAGVARYGK